MQTTLSANTNERAGLDSALRSMARKVLMPVLLATVLLTGCGSQPTDVPETGAAPDDAHALDSPPARHEPALVARASSEVEVYDDPSDPARARTLPGTTRFGFTTVLLVTAVGDGAEAGWLEVLLPERPNGSTGWVRAEVFDLREVDLEVVVDLDARQLTVFDAGEVLLTTPTAIGDAEHPTPTGSFYVTDKLETLDPDGAYGPYALGLSAYSDVLTEFAGGAGQVGIHGTNVSSSIGQAASHGCLRVPNDVIEQLAHLLPLGTPVTIF